MSHRRLLGPGLTAAWLAAGCVAGPFDTDVLPRGDAHALAVAEDAPARPAGWGLDSHDPGARPDYERVFPDRVQRIDIAISRETLVRMYDDLTLRISAPQGKSGFASTPRSPAAEAACADGVFGQPCTFLDVQGTCEGILPATPDSGSPLLSCREPHATDAIPGDPVTVDATVRVDGKVWTHVGVRLKGDSSLLIAWHLGLKKLGLRLDFDRFEDEHPETKNQRHYGFGKLVLNPAHTDLALIREKLASDLLRESRLPAARAAFYRVYIDAGDTPQYWGLYTALEDPADVLPRTQFSDGSGNLYKPEGPGADFTRLDEHGFEKKSNEKAADYGDVARAIAALHASRTDSARWRRDLESTFDVDVFLRTLALHRAIGNWDSYGATPHNYYLYGDPARAGRLVWISWDLNLAWTKGLDISVMMDELRANWPLVRFLLDDPVYRAQYRAALKAQLRGPYDKPRFDAQARRLHALIAPYVIGAQGERAPFTYLNREADFAAALPELRAAADHQRAAIEAALANEAAAHAAIGEEAGRQVPVAASAGK